MKSLLNIILVIILILSSACTQAKISIRAMFDGAQVIEVAENRQLTTLDDGSVWSFRFSPDGKFIAYANLGESDSSGMTQRARLAVVSPFGGRSTVLLDAQQYEDNAIPAGKDLIAPESVQQIAWSPDSRSVAVCVSLYRETRENQWGAILLLNRNGSKRTTFNLPKNAYVLSPLVWSPNGRKIAVTVLGATDPQEKSTSKIVLFDINTNIPSISIDAPEHMVNFEKFSEDSNGLICTIIKDRAYSRVEIPISGQSVKTLEDKISHEKVSPNGFYRVIPGKPGVTLEHIASKREIPLIVKPDSAFINWSPNGNLFLFAKGIEIKDDTDYNGPSNSIS
jgi:dipeptidyl aminopeptidase/acylaminoacyl peptidase